MRRILADIFLLISVFIFPWWLVLFLGALGLFLFRSFYEMLFLGVIIDSFYNAPIAPFHGFQFVAMLLSVFLFVTAQTLKRHMRFYGK